MKTFNSKAALAASAIAIAASMPASADNTGLHTVYVEQLQLGATIAQFDVIVPDHAEAGLSAASTAVGNSATGIVTGGDIDFDAIQTNECCTSAVTTVTGGSAKGDTIVATTAYANAAQGGTTNGHSYYRADQISTGNTSSGTFIDMGSAERLTSVTTAAANVSVSGSEFGDNKTFQTQAMTGNVTATTSASVCCTTSSGTLATTAAGNSASSTGWTSTSYMGAVQTTGPDAAIRADSSVYMQAGTNVVGSASAAGNSVALANEWGFATLGRKGSEVYQGNEASVDAVSSVELDHWSGQSASVAYGVGNSAMVSNIGSDTHLYAIQGNYGDVSATSYFTGQAWTGGTGGSTAIAIGNAASAFLCNTCGDGALGGATRQTNYGSVTAQSTTYVPHSGGIVGSATAIGNSASYTSSGH
jgi:hypothetical protein